MARKRIVSPSCVFSIRPLLHFQNMCFQERVVLHHDQEFIHPSSQREYFLKFMQRPDDAGEMCRPRSTTF